MKKFGLFFVILMVMMAVGCSNSSNGHDDGDAISTGRDTGNGSGTGNAGNGNANNNSNSGSGNRVTGVDYHNNWPSTLNGKILVCEYYEVALTYYESYYLSTGLTTAAGMVKRQEWEYSNYEYIVCTSDTEAIRYQYGIMGYAATLLTYTIDQAHNIHFTDGLDSWSLTIAGSGNCLRRSSVTDGGTGYSTTTGAKDFFEWTGAPSGSSASAAMTVEELFD